MQLRPQKFKVLVKHRCRINEKPYQPCSCHIWTKITARDIYFPPPFFFSFLVHAQRINGALCQDDGHYFHRFGIQDRTAGTACIQLGLLLYAGSFKLDIFGSDSIKISAAMLPRDKCCTKITVAADLVPKVQYILRASANTPKRCTCYPDTIAPAASVPAGYCANQIAFRLALFSRSNLPPFLPRISRVLSFATSFKLSSSNLSKIVSSLTIHKPLANSLSSLDDYSNTDSLILQSEAEVRATSNE